MEFYRAKYSTKWKNMTYEKENKRQNEDSRLGLSWKVPTDY